MTALINYYFLLFAVFSTVHPKTFRQADPKQELEDYIERKKFEINPRYRLQYHVAPPVGWMNDPNGFSYFKGEYHLFYQFYPYDSVWGPMHWGHVSSSNLVDWRQLPTALLPEEEQCFSGSAVVDGDTMILMYTGHEITDSEPFYNETQYLAYSIDGVNFEKYKGNPVLPSAPNGSPDFRDPKVWKNGDYWYVVIGSKTDDQRGQVLLYRSLDLISWDFLKVLGESNGTMGYMWECPDFFEMNERYVLLMSPQGLEPQGDRYKNLYQTGYIIGDFNYDTFEFVPTVDFQEIDYGHDFYATQTTEHNGKRILIAWFGMWETPHPEDTDGWAGAMTIFRELEMVENRILMKPMDEMLNLREELFFSGEWISNEIVQFEKTGEILLTGDLEKVIEVLIEGSESGDRVWIKWDPEVGKMSVNRSGEVRQVEWLPIDSRSWRLFIDSSSLELFCGEGEVVFSTRAYPTGNWKVTNLSPQVLSMQAYKLRRSVAE